MKGALECKDCGTVQGWRAGICKRCGTAPSGWRVPAARDERPITGRDTGDEDDHMG